MFRTVIVATFVSAHSGVMEVPCEQRQKWVLVQGLQRAGGRMEFLGCLCGTVDVHKLCEHASVAELLVQAVQPNSADRQERKTRDTSHGVTVAMKIATRDVFYRRATVTTFALLRDGDMATVTVCAQALSDGSTCTSWSCSHAVHQAAKARKQGGGCEHMRTVDELCHSEAKAAEVTRAYDVRV